MPDTFKSYQWQPSGEAVSTLNINDTSSHFITVTAHNNCSNTQSYKPINNCKMTLFMPNTFTPNKDGRNDVLKIQGHYIQNATMQIYTRWGELVFQSDDINQGWDGTYKGETVQEGIYLVKLKLTSMPQLNGQTPHAYYELMLNVLR
jgi:gliding motility-associated-like protein